MIGLELRNELVPRGGLSRSESRHAHLDLQLGMRYASRRVVLLTMVFLTLTLSIPRLRLWGQGYSIERTVLRLLALWRLDGRMQSGKSYQLDDIGPLLSQRRRELDDLAERGVLRVTDRGKYVFLSPMMEWWVVKEIETRPDEATLAQMEQDLLGLSKTQMSQIKKVMTEIWKNREVVAGVARWIAGILKPLGIG